MKLKFLFLFMFVSFMFYGQVVTIEDIKSDLSPLSEKYGINIYFNDIQQSDYFRMWGEYEEVTNEDIIDIDRYAKIFADEFNKYSKSLIKKLNFDGVVFVKNLTYAGEPVSAIPDPAGKVIYYDVSYGNYNEEYVKLVIHHEFYQLIEEQSFGSMFYEDKQWKKINGEDATYVERPTKGAEGEKYSYKEHPTDGFVNSYARYALFIDKAETFAYLMIKDKYKQIIKWSKSDEILDNKVSYLFNFLGTNFGMTKEYFEKIYSIKEEKKEEKDIEQNKNDKGKKTYIEYGGASYYADKYNGRKTASGEIFDNSKLTAAHKFLQFGTFVKVTNNDNGKSIVVKVNDRGPFVEGRIIDLTYKAAQILGIIKKGVGDVKIEVVDDADTEEGDDTVVVEEDKEKDKQKDQKTNFNELYGETQEIDLNRLKNFISQGVENKIDIGNLTPDNLINSALKYKGVNYSYGNASKNGVDCSGLSMLAFKEWGIDIPRGVADQARMGKFVSSKDKLEKGDLIFFTRTYNTKNFITHVGIYIGDRMFINANSYYGKVMVESVDDNYWKKFYIFGTRVF